MTADVIDIVVPGDLATDARRARLALHAACVSGRKADAREAVQALRVAGSWVYGTPAWEELRRAAQRVELRLHTRQPWVRVAREQLEAVGDLLRRMAGEELECGEGVS